MPREHYPFFRVTMEDVWVWDKNRPSRMIPRTRDLHVARRHRRGAARRGRRAGLTAEALAERIGESHSADDDT